MINPDLVILHNYQIFTCLYMKIFKKKNYLCRPYVIKIKKI